MRIVKMIIQIVLLVLAIWLVAAVIGLLAAAISGRVKRAYPVLPPDQVLRINGADRKVSDWAAEYQPIMKIRSTTSSPPLLNRFYNAVENLDTVTFIYYHVWEDEIHPNPIYHALYWVFRAAYYGYPVRDIEYFQVEVDRKSGDVTGLLFETSPGNDYYVTYSVHLVDRLKRAPGGPFTQTLSEKNGTLVSPQQNMPVQFEDHHVVVGVATWNHLTQLVTGADPGFDQTLSVPLKFLTDADYQNMKFARKSQGDYVTKETGLSLVLGKLGGFLVLSPLVLLLKLVSVFKPKR